MGTKRHKPEEIVAKLWQADVLVSQGVWSYDFVETRTHDRRKFRMLNEVDKFSRECVTIRVARKLKAIDVLSDLFSLRGMPGHVRSDNHPEFIATSVQVWITAVGAKTA